MLLSVENTNTHLRDYRYYHSLHLTKKSFIHVAVKYLNPRTYIKTIYIYMYNLQFALIYISRSHYDLNVTKISTWGENNTLHISNCMH